MSKKSGIIAIWIAVIALCLSVVNLYLTLNGGRNENQDIQYVMYLGTIMEQAPVKELFANPLHPYTKALFSAIPMPDPDIKKERSGIHACDLSE